MAPDLAPQLKLGRMLVVDDVALNREILVMQLGDTILHFDEAAEGREALALFKQRHYDAVLLDIEMPGLDGYGTLHELRRWEKEQRIPPTPVVAITGSDFPGDKQRILDAGATAYLMKPVRRQELMAALKLHCIANPGPNPIANLWPRFFASARAILSEMAEMDNAEAIAKNLHKMRGIIAFFGFEEFGEHLKQMHSGVQQGNIPQPAEIEQLKQELQQLENVSLNPSQPA